MSEDTEAIKEIAKATEEIAKTTGKAIDAGRELGQFVAKFIKGPLEQGIGIVEDKLKYMRWERQVRFMKRADDFMHEIGLKAPTRVVPMKFALPLLQAASLEDDDDLQDRWAKLLINAADAESGVDLKRAYIDILEQISPLEAQILDKIYSLPYEGTRHKGLLTKYLPERVDIVTDDPKLEHERPTPEVELALANIARLGCISIGMSWGGGQLFSIVNPTLLGKSFVKACRLKGK
jgi:hypothetical protein